MQAIGNNLSNEQLEILTQKLSEIQNLISGKTIDINHLPSALPVTVEYSNSKQKTFKEGFKQVIENKKQYLFRTTTITAYANASIEILSGIFPAFKPFEVQIDVKNEKGEQRNVEILSLSVMGNPQLINYSGTTVEQNRGNSIIFKSLKDLDFETFGGSAGQGLLFEVKNPYNEQLIVTILLIGSEDAQDNVGISDEFSIKEIRGDSVKIYKSKLPIRSYLFSHTLCENKQSKKLSVFSGRKEKFEPKKLQINVLDLNGKQTTINLLDISHRRSSKLINSTCVKIPTSFFEEAKEINFGEFGQTENQALIFEFENPTEKDVRIYITLE